MTLSDPEVIKLLSEDVVPCWESVGPVPKVTIELGNGRVLKRTLGGNIVTYLLSSQGQVYDAFPGVYMPWDYLGEIRKTLELIRQIKPDSEAEEVLSWHRKELARTIQSEERRTTLSKAFVESPLLKSLSGRKFPKAGTVQAENPSTAFQTYTAELQDISKKAATVDELRSSLLHDLQLNDPKEVGRAAVEIDSRNNLRLMRPAVHLLFSSYGSLPNVQECRDAVFGQILHIPIHDPYLGLADALVPGTPVENK